MESFEHRLISPKFTKEFGAAASIVLGELVDRFIDNEDVFKMSLNEICDATGLGIGAVKRAITKLEAYGFIKTHCEGVHNVKHFLVPYPDDVLEEYFNTFKNIQL